MSQYRKELKALEARKCGTCLGLGECDDAGMGDISFNTWQCTSCGGTGVTEPSTAILEIHKLIDAWGALPGGRSYSIARMSRWLEKDMAPAINEARAFL